MSALGPAAIAAMYKAAGLPPPGAAGVLYYMRKGAAGSDLLKSNLAKNKNSSTYVNPNANSGTDGTNDAGGTGGMDDIIKNFIDSIKGGLPKPGPTITPFDQSGFYNEGDVKALADQEYDPWLQKEQAYHQSSYDENSRQQAVQRAADEKAQLEAVNASGGFRSSAYQQDKANQSTLNQGQDAQRREALVRMLEDQRNQGKGYKEQFVQNRRGEAYNRYLQSTGAASQYV